MYELYESSVINDILSMTVEYSCFCIWVGVGRGGALSPFGESRHENACGDITMYKVQHLFIMTSKLLRHFLTSAKKKQSRGFCIRVE